jgi:hypothetical protein
MGAGHCLDHGGSQGVHVGGGGRIRAGEHLRGQPGEDGIHRGPGRRRQWPQDRRHARVGQPPPLAVEAEALRADRSVGQPEAVQDGEGLAHLGQQEGAIARSEPLASRLPGGEGPDAVIFGDPIAQARRGLADRHDPAESRAVAQRLERRQAFPFRLGQPPEKEPGPHRLAAARPTTGEELAKFIASGRLGADDVR